MDRNALLSTLALLAAGVSAGGAATIEVDTLVDADAADGECSLREAIVAANGDLPHNGCSAGAGDDGCDVGAVEVGTVAAPDGFLFGSRFENGLSGWAAVVGAR